MSISLVSVGSSATVSSGNLPLTLPTGTQSGDLLVASIAARGNDAFTLPSGWSLAGTQQSSGNTSTTSSTAIASGLMAYIVRTSSTPSGVFTRTNGDVATGIIVAYRSSFGSLVFRGGDSITLAANANGYDLPITCSAGDLVTMLGAAADNVEFIQAFGSSFDGWDNAADGVNTDDSPGTTLLARINGPTTTGADTALLHLDGISGSSQSGSTTYIQAGNTSRHVFAWGAFYEGSQARSFGVILG